MADLLTPEGFSLDKVAEMIDGSELGALKKTALKTALSGAQDNPELLSGVLEQIKGALGM
jgi:colicin import membrane protein